MSICCMQGKPGAQAETSQQQQQQQQQGIEALGNEDDNHLEEIEEDGGMVLSVPSPGSSRIQELKLLPQTRNSSKHQSKTESSSRSPRRVAVQLLSLQHQQQQSSSHSMCSAGHKGWQPRQRPEQMLMLCLLQLSMVAAARPRSS